MSQPVDAGQSGGTCPAVRWTMQAYTKAYSTNWAEGVKRIFGLLMVLGFSLGPIGCITHKPNAGSGQAAGQTPESDFASLELNAGRRWVMAKPMLVHLRGIETAVLEFNGTSGEDHARLATQIQEALGRLVTNCTMEGAAHDELHKWLMPFLALSADYARATDLQVQQQKLADIRQALRVFNEYFE